MRIMEFSVKHYIEYSTTYIAICQLEYTLTFEDKKTMLKHCDSVALSSTQSCTNEKKGEQIISAFREIRKSQKREKMTKSKKDNKISEYEKILKLVNSFNSSENLTKKQKEQRVKCFNIRKNPDIMGPTMCPYDSPAYCSLNSPVLSTEEIECIIQSTEDLDALCEIAMSLDWGDETIRDIHATKKIYEYIRDETQKIGDMKEYLWTNIHLGELLALPIGFGNSKKAMPYFRENYDLIMNNPAEKLEIPDADYGSLRYWSAMCVAFCYENFGQQEKANKIYKSVTRDLPEGIDLYAIFIRIVNKARSIILPKPEQLEKFADQLEEAVKETLKRNGGKKSLGFAKFENQPKSWRARARILKEQENR